MPNLTRGTRWLLILTGGVVVLAALVYFTILEMRKSSISSAIKSSRKVVLYEGLPHQHNERELLESERKTRKTIELNEFPFYEDRPALKEDDAKQLTALLTSASTLTRWRGEKKCGGFHPDWCIEWQDGDAICRVLVCFGCHEFKCYTGTTGTRFDFGDGVKDQLEKILLPYQKNRPAKSR